MELKKIRLPIVIYITLLLIACGGGSGGGAPGSNTNGVTLNTLARDFPVSENSNFSSAGIDQSFVCIDEANGDYYYSLVFDPSGTITSPELTTNLSYTLANNQLNIDVSPFFGSGVSYQHIYHVHAGALVVGFIGNLTDGVDNAQIACIAASHNYSDTVPQSTTITCQSSTGSNSASGSSFYHETTNRFTLEPNHYAQRYFNSEVYNQVSDPNSSIGSSLGSYGSSNNDTQHGSYLYDAASGEFVMGFMYLDPSVPEVDLLVFEGLTNGNQVGVELSGGEMRECAFE
jgi:hypothetical protein